MLLLVWSLRATWALTTHSKYRAKTAQDLKSLLTVLTAGLCAQGQKTHALLWCGRASLWVRYDGIGGCQLCSVLGHSESASRVATCMGSISGDTSLEWSFSFSSILSRTGGMVPLVGTLGLDFVRDGPLVPGCHLKDPNQGLTYCYYSYYSPL
jgi:hypothetical protein